MENNKMHILVVDDDNRIRDLLKEYLTEKDYIVSTSDNAENAKIKITQFKFDLIVLDVMMPGQDGYDLTKEIKKNMKVPKMWSKYLFHPLCCPQLKKMCNRVFQNLDRFAPGSMDSW